MVFLTQKFRQPSFLKILPLALFVGALCSCQTHKEKTPARPVASQVGLKAATPVTVPLPQVARPIVDQPAKPLKETPASVPAPAVRQSIDLPDSLPGCTITRLSSNQWRAVSRRRFALGDSPPSLMEDAIITSSIHARLQKLALSQKTPWQYGSNAGVVSLKTASLTREEAVSAIQAVLGLDNVSEVRLTTRLQ